MKLVSSNMPDGQYVLVRATNPRYLKVDVIPLVKTRDSDPDETMFKVKDRLKALIGKSYPQLLLFLVSEEDFIAVNISAILNYVLTEEYM
jgi:hypothetical protein